MSESLVPKIISNSRLFLLVHLLGVGVYLYIVFYIVDIKKTILSLDQINLSYFFLASAIFFLVIFLKAFRWVYINHSYGIYFTLGEGYKLYNLAYFTGGITPGRLGEFLTIFFSYKRSNSVTSAVRVGLFDKGLEVGFILLYGGLCFLLFMKGEMRPVFIVMNFVLSATSLFLIVCLFNSSFISYRITERLTKKFVGLFRIEAQSPRVTTPQKNPMTPKSCLFVVLICSLLYAVIYVQNILIAKSMGIEIPLFYFYYLSGIATVMALLPITFAGLGTREAIYIFLFTHMGLSKEEAFTYSLLCLALYLLQIGIAFSIAQLFFTKLKLSQQGKTPAEVSADIHS